MVKRTVYTVVGTLNIGHCLYSLPQNIIASNKKEAVAKYQAEHPNAKCIQIEKIIHIEG
jgi:hypothetical protein